MADKQINIASNTREEVAFKLASRIVYETPENFPSQDFRKEFLDLFAECLIATNGYRKTDK